MPGEVCCVCDYCKRYSTLTRPAPRPAPFSTLPHPSRRRSCQDRDFAAAASQLTSERTGATLLHGVPQDDRCICEGGERPDEDGLWWQIVRFFLATRRPPFSFINLSSASSGASPTQRRAPKSLYTHSRAFALSRFASLRCSLAILFLHSHLTLSTPPHALLTPAPLFTLFTRTHLLYTQ